MREEAVEEAKLARERERIQQQHEMDQRKQREKEVKGGETGDLGAGF